MQETDVQNQIREIWSFGWPETNIFPGLVLEHQNDLNLLISRLSILSMPNKFYWFFSKPLDRFRFGGS